MSWAQSRQVRSQANRTDSRGALVSPRRLIGAIAVVLLTSISLTACGGEDEPSGNAATQASSTPSATGTPEPEPEEPHDTALQQPKAAETIQPRASLSAVPGASELPAQGFRTVQG